MSSKRTSLEGAQLPVASLSRAGSASIPELAHASTLDYCVVKTIVELEGFGVTVAEGDKVSLPQQAVATRFQRESAANAGQS